MEQIQEGGKNPTIVNRAKDLKDHQVWGLHFGTRPDLNRHRKTDPRIGSWPYMTFLGVTLEYVNKILYLDRRARDAQEMTTFAFNYPEWSNTAILDHMPWQDSKQFSIVICPYSDAYETANKWSKQNLLIRN